MAELSDYCHEARWFTAVNKSSHQLPLFLAYQLAKFRPNRFCTFSTNCRSCFCTTVSSSHLSDDFLKVMAVINVFEAQSETFYFQDILLEQHHWNIPQSREKVIVAVANEAAPLRINFCKSIF